VAKDPSQIKLIQKHETKPLVLSQCLPHESIRKIMRIQKECFLDKERCHQKLFKDQIPQGITAHPSPIHHKNLSDIIRPVLKNELTLPYDIDFAFHQNKFPYGVHTDSGYDPNEMIYKQGIIPLEIHPVLNDVYTIIFEQKVYHSYGISLDKIADIRNELWYQLPKNVSSTEHIPLDQKYFEYLSPALSFQWKIGDMAIWDRAHLHCSSEFQLTGIKEKLGLMWITKIKAP